MISGALFGRPKAITFEPHFHNLLHALSQAWNASTYEKETAPIVATIDEYESANQIKGKIYAY